MRVLCEMVGWALLMSFDVMGKLKWVGVIYENVRVVEKMLVVIWDIRRRPKLILYTCLAKRVINKMGLGAWNHMARVGMEDICL